MEQILSFIGAIVLGGGTLSVIVYHVFKHLAVKWLDAKFDERLEQLRFKIASLLDRTTKLHQREFETLPEAWSKLTESFWRARSVLTSLRQYPDINAMPPASREEFITQCSLAPWEKDELRQARDKNGYYQKRIDLHNLQDAKSLAREASVFVMKNGIFFEEEMRKQFDALLEIVWSALTEHEINEVHGVRPRVNDKVTALQQNGEGMLRALETRVHQRLWPKEPPTL